MGQRSAGGHLEKPVPGVARWGVALLTSLGQWAAATSVSLRRRRRPGRGTGDCPGHALPADAKTYLVLPFEVSAHRAGAGRPRGVGLPDVDTQIVNPFFRPAVDLWEDLLNRGHWITAVCGSDDKRGDRLGSCATAMNAGQLSRPALTDAIRAGRAYVRARGVAHSPALEMVATTADGHRGIFGDTLPADAAEVTVTVTGGAGQALRVVPNGQDVATVPVTADPFTHTFPAERVAGEGPLGTWYRVETFDARVRTTIGNSVFLGGSR